MALVDVMESNPAIVENCRSSGVATAEDIVSGLAPGRLAQPKIVGKSTVGRSLTPRVRNAIAPNNAMATNKSDVAPGRQTNTSDIFTRSSYEVSIAEYELIYKPSR